jgi:hypothetical protein
VSLSTSSTSSVSVRGVNLILARQVSKVNGTQQSVAILQHASPCHEGCKRVQILLKRLVAGGFAMNPVSGATSASCITTSLDADASGSPPASLAAAVTCTRCDVARTGRWRWYFVLPKMPAFHQQLRMVAVVSAFEACAAPTSLLGRR